MHRDSSECTVVAFKWSGARCRVRGVFFLDSNSAITLLYDRVRAWLGTSNLVLFRLSADGDGVMPIATLLSEHEQVGPGGTFGCNIYHAAWVDRSIEYAVSVSFFMFYEGRFEFAAPPLVVPSGGTWAGFLRNVGSIVTSVRSSVDNLLRCDVYSLLFEGGEYYMSAIRGHAGPRHGDSLAICLGSVSHSGKCLLNLPHESVVCKISDIHVSGPFLSLSLTAIDDSLHFVKPWVFDISF